MADLSTSRRPEPGDGSAAETIALAALAWTLAEPARAERLLALTGLDPAELRQRIGEPALLGAVIGFLAGHEPDLVACAAAIGTTPAALAAAGAALSGGDRAEGDRAGGDRAGGGRVEGARR